MQPNGNQNLWQPQDEPVASPPVPPTSQPTLPQAPASAPAPTPPAVPMASVGAATTPHEEVFVPPSQPVGSSEPEATDEAIMSWEASEYIDHEKDFLWFIGFTIVVLVFLAVAVWVQAWTFVVLTIIMAIATIVYVRRPPRVMRYSISDEGLHIGAQFHPYSEYRAFGVVEDGSFPALMLVSTKRFLPATLIYFDDKDGERIIDILNEHLPLEDLDLDLAEVIIRKLRL